MISRETVIGDMSDDNERIQYDAGDFERFGKTGDAFVAHMTDFVQAYGEYIAVTQAPADGETITNVAYARREMLEKWGIAQAALSKTAWILRFDGQEVFDRVVNALKNKTSLDVSGL